MPAGVPPTPALAGVSILYQENLTSDTTTKSFYAGSLQVAQMVNYTTYYLHQDALGSTRLVTNGAILAFKSNFGPYGVNYAMSGAEAFQYTGKLMDVVDGLYYEGARYYDPTTGRFITEDSYNGTVTDPLSQNRYVYALDDPMRYTDPTGHAVAPPSYAVEYQQMLDVTTSTVTIRVMTDDPETMLVLVATTTTTTTVCAPGGCASRTHVNSYVEPPAQPGVTSGPTVGLTGGGGPTDESETIGSGLACSNRCQSTLVLAGEYGATGVLGGLFPPSLLLTGPGVVSATIYYATTPNSTPSGELNAYANGVSIAARILRFLGLGF